MDWPDAEYLPVIEDFDLGLALMFDLPESGPMLLVSDAISRPDEVVEAFAGSWDEGLAIKNGNRLIALAKEKGAEIIYGHCPAQWSKLRKTPDYYG